MYHTTNNTTTTVGLSTATLIEQTTGECSTLTTLELVYPRYIHSEFMTHRMFSRNASSSRATPVSKMIQEVCDNPVIPTELYKNCKGMQGKELLCDTNKEDAYVIDCFRAGWEEALDNAVRTAKALEGLGVHKQHINRVLEPFQFIRVVVTATEWENFFDLRDSDMAQPEIRDLARAIKGAMHKGFTKLHLLHYYHLPYVTQADITKIMDECPKHIESFSGNEIYAVSSISTVEDLSINAILEVSAARCARVSYLKHDGTQCDIFKDIALGKQLIRDRHMSPMEHQATIAKKPFKFYKNFEGFKSYRYMLEHGKI